MFTKDWDYMYNKRAHLLWAVDSLRDIISSFCPWMFHLEFNKPRLVLYIKV